jgi:hypothetical protein
MFIMNGRMAKAMRRKARQMAAKETTALVPKFKAFVNKELSLVERIVLAWKIIWKRF